MKTTSAVISLSDHRDAIPAIAPDTGPIFQRNVGAIDLVFDAPHGVTRLRRAYQQGAMKMRFPNVAREHAPEAVLVNISGGLTGGDRIDMGVTVEQGASATVTTQACEKIYRSLGPDALIDTRLTLKPQASLDWLPQASILFDRARLKRGAHVEMSADATLLALEAVIFGRTAMGESFTTGALSDAWTIRRDGRLIHADRLALEGDVATQLTNPAILAGHKAMAAIRYVAPDAHARLDDMRAILAETPGISAASAWNGMLLVRLVAADGYALNAMLIHILQAFRGRPLPRAWHI